MTYWTYLLHTQIESVDSHAEDSLEPVPRYSFKLIIRKLVLEPGDSSEEPIWQLILGLIAMHGELR